MPLRVVSSGGTARAATQVVVPDVGGFTEAEARLVLADFTVRVRAVEAPGAAGTVFAQDPAAASVRPRRSPVSIFLIVNPVPDSGDVAGALNDLTQAVDALSDSVETEQSAKSRHDAVLLRLQEIKDGLPASGTGSGSGSGTTTSSTTKA